LIDIPAKAGIHLFFDIPMKMGIQKAEIDIYVYQYKNININININIKIKPYIYISGVKRRILSLINAKKIGSPGFLIKEFEDDHLLCHSKGAYFAPEGTPLFTNIDRKSVV
jgi:hypothetical protein